MLPEAIDLVVEALCAIPHNFSNLLRRDPRPFRNERKPHCRLAPRNGIFRLIGSVKPYHSHVATYCQLTRHNPDHVSPIS